MGRGHPGRPPVYGTGLAGYSDTRNMPGSSAEAKRLDEEYYYTGQPCARGHDAPRYAKSRVCAVCALKWANYRYEMGLATNSPRRRDVEAL